MSKRACQITEINQGIPANNFFPAAAFKSKPDHRRLGDVRIKFNSPHEFRHKSRPVEFAAIPVRLAAHMGYGLNEKTAAPTTRVNNCFVRFWVNHLDGQADNWMRREKFPAISALMAIDKCLKCLALHVAGRLSEVEHLKPANYESQRHRAQSQPGISG